MKTEKSTCKVYTLKKYVPIPGVEPGPPGWKPGILTARPYGIAINIPDQTVDTCIKKIAKIKQTNKTIMKISS